MQLTEFITHFNDTMKVRAPNHDRYVPTIWHDLIVQNAENGRPWDDAYGPDDSFFGDKEVRDYDVYREMIEYKLGGLCAWVDKRGTVYPIGYACHNFAREALIPLDEKQPTVKLENRCAHISFGERSVEKMTNYVHDAFQTSKMMHSVLRFCWNVRRHPLVLKFREEGGDWAEKRTPYPCVEPLVEELNRNAQRDRDMITLYTPQEMAHLFNEPRVRNDIAKFVAF